MTKFALGRQLEVTKVEMPGSKKVKVSVCVRVCVCVCVEQVETSDPRPFSQPAGQMRPAPVAPPSGGVSVTHAQLIWSKSM